MKRLWFILWRISKADVRTLWFAIRYPDRPWWVRPAAAFLLIYAISPLNFMLPVFGLIDEFVLIPLILHMLVLILPDELRYSSSLNRSV